MINKILNQIQFKPTDTEKEITITKLDFEILEQELTKTITNKKRDIKRFNLIINTLKQFKTGLEPFYFTNLLRNAEIEKDTENKERHLNNVKLGYYLRNSNILKPIYKGFIIYRLENFNHLDKNLKIDVKPIDYINNISYFNIKEVA